jgi:hypothetical protein
MFPREYVTGVVLVVSVGMLAHAAGPAGGFLVVFDPTTGFVSSLRQAGETDPIEFIRPGAVLGPVVARASSARIPTEGASWRDVKQDVGDVRLQSSFQVCDDVLRWKITVKNAGKETIELGDLALPLSMNTDYSWDHVETFNRRLFKHAFIEGHGSFVYWLPVKGSGPFLVMMPEDDTHLEYFTAEGMDYAFGKEQFCVFIHSKASAETNTRGTWRQPRTSLVLQAGDEACYAFTFRLADSYEGLRQLLRQNGGVDIQVVPGMVIPRDLEAHFCLRTLHKTDAIEAEFPAQTKIERLPSPTSDNHLFRVQFGRLGENVLTA